MIHDSKKRRIFNQLKEQFDELNYRWSRERDKLEANLQHESADAKKEFEAKREEFRRLRGELEKKIADLDAAGDNAWGDIQEGAENAWKELGKAFEKATSHFKV